MAVGKNIFGSMTSSPQTFIMGIIFIYLGITLAVELLPLVITAIINLSGVSNLGFSSFFGADGIVLKVLSIAILLAIIGLFGLGKAKR